MADPYASDYWQQRGVMPTRTEAAKQAIEKAEAEQSLLDAIRARTKTVFGPQGTLTRAGPGGIDKMKAAAKDAGATVSDYAGDVARNFTGGYDTIEKALMNQGRRGFQNFGIAMPQGAARGSFRAAQEEGLPAMAAASPAPAASRVPVPPPNPRGTPSQEDILLAMHPDRAAKMQGARGMPSDGGSTSGASVTPASASSEPGGGLSMVQQARAMLSGGGGTRTAAAPAKTGLDNPAVQEALLAAAIGALGRPTFADAVRGAGTAGLSSYGASRKATREAAEKQREEDLARSKILLDAMRSDRSDAREVERRKEDRETRRAERSEDRGYKERSLAQGNRKLVATIYKDLKKQQDDMAYMGPKRSDAELMAQARAVASGKFGFADASDETAAARQPVTARAVRDGKEYEKRGGKWWPVEN